MLSISPFEIHMAGNLLFRSGGIALERGELIWLTGANATGKSRFLETLAGKHALHSGLINYDFGMGDPYSKIRYLGFLDDSKAFSDRKNQFYQQRFHSAYSEGLPRVCDLISRKSPREQQRAQEYLELFEIANLRDRELIKLSSGQTRKVILANALASDPELLLLDNPYIGLDVRSRTKLEKGLQNLLEHRDICLILSDHVIVRPDYANRQLHIRNGRLEELALAKSDETGEPLFIDEQLLSQVESTYHRDLNPYGFSSFVEMDDVSIRYGDNQLIRNINWTVKAGERWLVIGPNGSGKSSLMSLVYSDIPQGYARNIRLFGKRAGEGFTIWEMKKHIGYSSPELHSYIEPSQAVIQLLSGGIKDRFVSDSSEEPDHLLLDLLMEYFALSNCKDRCFHQLSTGEQRLILFVRALLKKPALLVLDEPFQGVDSTNRQKALLLLERILHPGMALIFCSHNAEEIPPGITHQLSL